MAIFRSFLLGDVKKSVANLTMYIAKGVSIVRSKPLNVHNPRTDKQRIQRAKMKALVGLVSGFGPALSIGYPQVVGLKSANNRFVQDNMEIVTVDDAFKATIDFSRLVCSSGHLKVPKVSVSFKEEEKQFVFTQTVQQQTLTCNPTDVAWVVVYEKVQHESEVYPLKARKEPGGHTDLAYLLPAISYTLNSRMMNRLIYFMTGWLSTLSISNLMGGQGMELWRENLLSVIGGVCSAIIVAWLRWRWEHRDRRDT